MQRWYRYHHHHNHYYQHYHNRHHRFTVLLLVVVLHVLLYVAAYLAVLVILVLVLQRAPRIVFWISLRKVSCCCTRRVPLAKEVCRLCMCACVSVSKSLVMKSSLHRCSCLPWGTGLAARASIEA